MTKENEGVELETVAEIVKTQDDDGNDTTNWEEIALAKQEVAKQYEGLAKRNFTDLTKLKNDPRLKEEEKPEAKTEDQPVEKTDGFDYAEMSYLISKGIEESEFDFVLDRVKDSGKSLKDLIKADWFQSELKGEREVKATKEAIPTGSNRSVSTLTTETDYWIDKKDDKGKPVLPKDRELARKVVNERIKIDKSKSKFTDDPVV